MPPQKRKASGRKGPSKKKNVMYSTPEHVGLFGVQYKSLIKTPLGKLLFDKSFSLAYCKSHALS